ncbi:G5 domain-containing protein [Pilimelia columellifera]|uniref:G5 domain-containing protein n=1 Tax=Pilimelia columellifera TaxID=706574 RepID=UPI0031DEBAEC
MAKWPTATGKPEAQTAIVTNSTPQEPWPQGTPVPQRPHGWFRGNSAAKAALIAVAIFLAGCGGETQKTVNASNSTPTPLSRKTGEVTPSTDATPSAVTTTGPVVVKRTVTETGSIPFTTKQVNDPSLPSGSTKVKVPGVAGVKTLTFEVTSTNGAQTGKKLIRTVVTKRPITRVIAKGTKRQQRCDPNYSGACVPIASDVDCAGGSGNGPAYVSGPVKVTGNDIYDLDRDGDGYGCD